jgi:hypothetical protein
MITKRIANAENAIPQSAKEMARYSSRRDDGRAYPNGGSSAADAGLEQERS